MIKGKISYDYIRGLVEGEGSFTFTTKGKDSVKKERIPSFQLRMNIRDKDLLEKVRDLLGLKNKIYTYHYPESGGIKRGPQAMLIVREMGSLRNIIIPMFTNKLVGYKAKQFEVWVDKIGNDPLVPEGYRFLYSFYKLENFTSKFNDVKR